MAKIFIVEDELIVSLDLQQRVRDLGYEVIGSSDNGDAAINAVLETKPDLILMDINIKGKIDGIETSRLINQKYNVPIIYLTAYSDKATLERAKITTPYGYLIKPIEERDLHISIEISLTKFRMEGQLMESEKRLSITLQSIGDGVISTDKKGFITQMNKTAERMCGFTFAEAKGLPLNAVFKIRSAIKNENIYNPVDEVLRTGKVVELSNHTVLISKNGTERHISDSAAPILDDLNEIQGVVLVFSDVTDAYTHRRLLEQSEKLYREVIENASDLIYTIDKNGKFRHANSAALKFSGYTIEDSLNLHFTDLIVPEFRSFVKRHYFRQILEKTNTTYTEVPVLKKNGEICWFGQNVTLVFDGEDITGFHIISRDITERKIAQDALRKNEEMLRQIIDIIPDRIFVKDINGKFILNNVAHMKALGIKSQQEALGKTDRDFRSEERARTYETQDKNVIRTQVPLIDYVQHEIKDDGREAWQLVSKLPFKTDDGEVIGIVGISKEITDQKIADNLLRESKRRFQTLANVSPVGIFRTDVSGFTTFVNPRWCEISGLTAEEALGDGWLSAVHQEDRTGLSEEWHDAARTLRASRVDYRFVRPDGSIAWVMGQAVPEINENNLVVGFVGTITDITERKFMEEELRKLNQAVVQSPASIVITDTAAKIEYVNPKVLETSGYSLEELLGKNPNIFSSRKYPREGYKLLWETITSGKDWRGELPNKKKNGELYWESVSISSIKNDSGAIIHYIAIKEDITEKKKLEKGLIEAKERAETASELKDAFIANISHEIRTPLNGVLGATSIIKDSLSDHITPAEETYFDAIDRASKRIIRTVDMILNFSRLQVGDIKYNPQLIDLNSTLEEIYGEFYSSAKQKKIDLIFENKIGEIKINSDQYCLNQVFSNLLDNAIKYTKEGAVTISLYYDEENRIKIDFRDTGIGISEEYLKQIFNPYSQEEVGYKRAYDGVGLGLSLVKNLLELLDAEISVQSVKGVGSTFSISFSNSVVTSGTEIDKKSGGNDPEQFTRPEKEKKADPVILVVEDDGINQLFLSLKLKQFYDVIVVDNASKAMEVLNSRHIDLILMDISIKGEINGLELTRMVRESEKFNKIPVIALTGHAFDDYKKRCFDAGCNDLISKPFSIEELLSKLSNYIVA